MFGGLLTSAIAWSQDASASDSPDAEEPMSGEEAAGEDLPPRGEAPDDGGGDADDAFADPFATGGEGTTGDDVFTDPFAVGDDADDIFTDPFAVEDDSDDIFADPFAVEGSADDVFADPFATSGDEPAGEDMFADPFGDADDEPSTTNEFAGESAGGDRSSSDDPFAFGSIDELFMDEEMLDEISTEAQATAPQDDLLVNEEGLVWGGRISAAISADWSWDDAWTPDFGALDPISRTLTPELAATLFFDARPESDFRAFGKLRIDASQAAADLGGLIDTATVTEDDSGNFVVDLGTDEEEEEADVDEREEEQQDPALGSGPTLQLSILELFTDFSVNERAFFRFGKYAIRWGVGYFWSPTDVLNLSAIDEEDPTADREGPISLKMQIPFGITGNAYLYTLTNNDAAPLDVALAPKVEFRVGDGELGIGGYYQRSLSPRVVSTLTYSLGDLDIFAEGVVSLGSDRTFVRPSRDQSAAEEDDEDDLDLVLDTYEVDDRLFASGSVGWRYVRTFEEVVSLAFIGQYYFNGEGYTRNPTFPYDDRAYTSGELRTAALRLLNNAAENGLAIDDADEQPDGYEDPPALAFTDITDFGRHYLGATLSLSELFDSDLGLSVLFIGNLTDLSGIISPQVSVQLFEEFSLSGGPRFTFGHPGGEYTNPSAFAAGDSENDRPSFSLSVSASFGGGSF